MPRPFRRAPIPTTTRGPSPAPTKSARSIGGQCTKSHAFRRRLSLHDQQALAREDEEVLLRVFGVVHPVRLPGEDADMTPT